MLSKRFCFMNSKWLTALIIIAAVCLGVVTFLIKNSDFGVLFTDDISDYNSDEYPMGIWLFPEEIPSDAEVVRFVYFDYWHEAADQYLELKFETLESMELYLAEAKKAILEGAENIPNHRIIEEVNEKNPTFVELFDSRCITAKGDDYYTGYEITREDSGEMDYDCNFGVLAYSFEELTVIHTYVWGGFRAHRDHVPEYFRRFDLVNEEKTKLIYLNK